MKKILIGATAVFGIIAFALFMMYRNVSQKNDELQHTVEELTASLTTVQETLQEKIQIIDKQNKKYQEILSSIEYNECENLPVSTTLVEAAKELQK